jgi:hypothetical protein
MRPAGGGVAESRLAALVEPVHHKSVLQRSALRVRGVFGGLVLDGGESLRNDAQVGGKFSGWQGLLARELHGFVTDGRVREILG